MRMIPGRWRLPLEAGALLLLTFPAATIASDVDRSRSATMETCVGTLLSIDREKRTCTVETSPGAAGAFRLDDDATLIFRAMRPLRIDDLRPGMRIEIDRRRAAGEESPTATWIEVLEEKH